ncbi:sigma-70 family RNA polymerase sigma factor [Streptomyces sp. NPDC087440]|uniref:sigma-70 family RNA polymerase sigma factor n=1 Tax=Streptomyces sp. NPDC087440 TaxID=3365790 RepID=UPI00382610C7
MSEHPAEGRVEPGGGERGWLVYEEFFTPIAKDIHYRFGFPLDVAEVITDKAFQELQKKHDKWTERDSPGRFWWWRAEKRAMDHARTEKRGRLAFEGYARLLEGWEAERPSFEDVAERNDLIRQLHCCLARLSPRDRRLLELDLQGRTSEERAALLGVLPGTERVAYHRAKLRLRELMEQEGAGHA